MKKLTLGGLTLAIAAFLGMVQFGAPTAMARSQAAAQTAPSGEQGDQSTQAQETPSRSKSAEVFVGTVSKQNGSYVLEAGSEQYKLSNQTKAAKYNGQKVEVYGKLKAASNTIHVKKIKSLGNG